MSTSNQVDTPGWSTGDWLISPSDDGRSARSFLRGLRVSSVDSSQALASAFLSLWTNICTDYEARLAVLTANTGIKPLNYQFTSIRPAVLDSRDREVQLNSYLFRSQKNHDRRCAILVHGWKDHCFGTGMSDRAAKLLEAGYDVLLFDLGASGKSTGRHYGMGLLEAYDVNAAVMFMQWCGYRENRTMVIADSMGAAATIKAISTPGLSVSRVAGVVLVAPYDNFSVVLNHVLGQWPLLPHATRLALVETIIGGARRIVGGELGWSTLPSVNGAFPPALVVLSAADETIPKLHALRVAALSGARPIILPGMEHEELCLKLSEGPKWGEIIDFAGAQIARATANAQHAL